MAAHATAAEARKHYVKIWGILLALLVISVLGPLLGHPIVTLITAFGIAVVKAYLVAKNFMHVTIERKYITYLMITMIALSLLFVGGVMPDVMKHDGARWENVSAKAAVARGMEEYKEHKAHPEGSEGGSEAGGHEGAPRATEGNPGQPAAEHK